MRRKLKGWIFAARIAAVFAFAQSSHGFAQATSSEYAPLAGAPAPGERKAPPVISYSMPPEAMVIPTPEKPVADAKLTATPTSAPEAATAPASEPVVQSSAAPVVGISVAPAEPPPTATATSASPQPTPAETAVEKKNAGQEKSARKEKEINVDRSASTNGASDEKLPRARLPEDGTLKYAAKLPPDDKGPRALSFISNCLDNYDNCEQFVQRQVERIPKGEICFPEGVDQIDITEKVRKFITLRPAIHDQAANRVVTEALYGIYSCRRVAPARTSADKSTAPKGAKQ